MFLGPFLEEMLTRRSPSERAANWMKVYSCVAIYVVGSVRAYVTNCFIVMGVEDDSRESFGFLTAGSSLRPTMHPF